MRVAGHEPPHRGVIEPYLKGVPLAELRRRLDEAYEEELGREEDLGAVRAEIHDLKHAIDVWGGPMRVAGHGLRREGRRAYDEHGHTVFAGRGTHGKCQCGLLFQEESDNAVRRAHREHKQQIIRESGGAT